MKKHSNSARVKQSARVIVSSPAARESHEKEIVSWLRKMSSRACAAVGV